MGKINRLDEHLSNMIAAGEVVERPSGIVKELVENCIDAQAQQVEIQILQGGIDTITIIDDGDGMDASDARLAFERHATSKLKEVNDLWNIHTMGFRGEALPSIASVSHVLLRTNNGVESTEIEIEYGTIIKEAPCGTPKGTRIDIKNLFQKTPARFKHLKSPQYEFSLISDVIQKFALSHPSIGFCLSHEGRTVLKTNGNGKLLEVLMQIYGRETVKTAIAVHEKNVDYQITGYCMQPHFNRATKYYMLLYINGRMIRNYRLQKAILDAYAAYMPKDRFPIVVVDILMDAQLVDVNVHPSKWEIRLSKEKQLEKFLYTTITSALTKHIEVHGVTATKPTLKEKVENQALQFQYKREDGIDKLHEEVNASFEHPEKQPILNMEELKYIVEETKQETKEWNYPNQPIPKKNIEERPMPYRTNNEQKGKPSVEQPKTAEVAWKDIPQQEELEYKAKHPSLPQLRVIGQHHACYILAEGEKGLYIIDQHAAQERYRFEVIRAQILQGNTPTQPLLLPITIESNITAITQLDEINDLLQKIGIHLEAFGEATFVCREVPIWMRDVKEENVIRDMIDIWEKEKEISIAKLRNYAIATMACHSSIRFHRNLSIEEMNQVIEDLGKCEQPFHCPHGRPTLICMEDKDLLKEFERG